MHYAVIAAIFFGIVAAVLTRIDFSRRWPFKELNDWNERERAFDEIKERSRRHL